MLYFHSYYVSMEFFLASSWNNISVMHTLNTVETNSQFRPTCSRGGKVELWSIINEGAFNVKSFEYLQSTILNSCSSVFFFRKKDQRQRVFPRVCRLRLPREKHPQQLELSESTNSIDFCFFTVPNKLGMLDFF